MAVLAGLTPLIAVVAEQAPETESAATEGKKIITAMLIVGLVFIGVIALGQTSRWLRHRRKERRARQAPQY
jgi:heme/copper-type cytochrome/quinol oxidase subunit 2